MAQKARASASSPPSVATSATTRANATDRTDGGGTVTSLRSVRTTVTEKSSAHERLERELAVFNMLRGRRSTLGEAEPGLAAAGTTDAAKEAAEKRGGNISPTSAAPSVIRNYSMDGGGSTINGGGANQTQVTRHSDVSSVTVGKMSVVSTDPNMGGPDNAGGGAEQAPSRHKGEEQSPAAVWSPQRSTGDEYSEAAESQATVISMISGAAAAFGSVTGKFLAQMGPGDDESSTDSMVDEVRIPNVGNLMNGAPPSPLAGGTVSFDPDTDAGTPGEGLSVSGTPKLQPIKSQEELLSPPPESNLRRRRESSNGSSHHNGAANANPRRLDPSLSVSFSDDAHRDMTYGRRLALHLMKRTWYYNPEAVQKAEAAKSEAFKSKHFDQSMRDIGRELELAREEEDDVEETAQDGMGGHDFALARKKYGAASSERGPSLEKAWAYFEHVTLPRYLVPNIYDTSGLYASSTAPLWQKALCCFENNLGSSTQLDRAEPGENTEPTRLYSPIFTPLSQMGDFGLGIGLYFSTLRALMIITLIAGLASIPNYMYYRSTDYSRLGQDNLKLFTQGSAICTDQPFVPCTDCNFDQFRRGAEVRLATPSSEVNSEEFTVFAQKNNCQGAQTMQVMINFGTFLFVFVAFFAMNKYQNRMEEKFDEDEQTAQDYSIVVNNPPHDAYDPQEWKEFFDQFYDTHVTCCTVTVGNDVLLHALLERRERLRQLEMLLPLGESMNINHIARIAAQMEAEGGGMHGCGNCLKAFGILSDIPSLYSRIVVLDAKIRGLAQRHYPATKVFITFETEDAQRTVLSAMSYAPYRVWKKDTTAVKNKEHLFRGKHILNVKEPAEPSSIRWQDLDQSVKTQIVQVAITTFVCICAVVLVAFIVNLCRNVDAVFAGLVISAFNGIFPLFAKFMTGFEGHPSEGSMQSSLYIKIALFRWVNTAIVITITTPFTSFLTEGDQHLIYAVYVIFFAELVTVPLVQFADPVGQLKRHYLGPRQPDQERMNLQFQGTPYDLAERYTTVTKILFLGFWYCALFPACFFFCALAFFLTYFFDRFSLMRTWSPAPKLGKQVAEFSRKYFFTTTIVIFAVIGSYHFSGFPYDNLCDTGLKVTSNATYTAFRSNVTNAANALTVQVTEGEPVYKFCSQDLMDAGDGRITFPALPLYQLPGSEWMTEEQAWSVNIYGWASVAVLGLMLLILSWRMYKSLAAIFAGGYKPVGKDMNINYSDVATIAAYIPEVKSVHYAYPLLAVDVTGLDDQLMSWVDPERPYDYYNLMRDVDGIFDGSAYSPNKHAFSQIRHWTPPEAEDLFGDVGIADVSQLTHLTES